MILHSDRVASWESLDSANNSKGIILISDSPYEGESEGQADYSHTHHDKWRVTHFTCDTS